MHFKKNNDNKLILAIIQDDPNTPHPASQNTTPLYWKYTVGGTAVQFDGVPFSIGEKRMMDCQYGHQYYKPRQALSKRVRLQGTRKMGCKAHIIQRQYILYPEFAIQSSCTYESKRQERLAKEEKLHQLRDHLSSQKPVKTKCLLCLPPNRRSTSFYTSHLWC